MCFPARSLYPPVLTPLGDRPPGNKSRLSDTLHPCSATTTTTTTTTHTPSQQSTTKKGGVRGNGRCCMDLKFVEENLGAMKGNVERRAGERG